MGKKKLSAAVLALANIEDRFEEYENKKIVVDRKLATTVRDVVACGLVGGVGDPKPGAMCVEAAVCYAIGQEHGDQPVCVEQDLIGAKIELNDSFKGTNKARAEALRRVAIAQLGTRGHNSGITYTNILNDLFNEWKAPFVKAKVQSLVDKANLNVDGGLDDLRADLENFSDEIPGEVDQESINNSITQVFQAIGYKPKKNEAVLIAAELLTQALIKAKAPGAQFLDLVPANAAEKKLAKSFGI